MTVLKHLVLSLVLIALPVSAAADTLFADVFTPPPAKEGYAYPDCYCTDSEGERVEVGEYACLRIGPREMTALCGMSQNSPAWRTQFEGCPSV
ncbi:MAG: hypothetical protein AAF318_12115 [Pseudomonadota bacterium]